MNNVESYTVTNPYGDTDECAKLTVDSLAYDFILKNITVIDQQYTFSFWAKSDAEGTILIGDHTYPTSENWIKYTVTFVAEKESFALKFGKTGMYYIYHAQLEIGNKATDYRNSPEDFAAAIQVNKDGIDMSVKKDGILSAINMSKEEIKILAEKIKLEGLITANGYFKVLEDGSIEAANGKFSGKITSFDGINIKDVETETEATIRIEPNKTINFWYLENGEVKNGAAEERTCLTISDVNGFFAEGVGYFGHLMVDKIEAEDGNFLSLETLVATTLLESVYMLDPYYTLDGGYQGMIGGDGQRFDDGYFHTLHATNPVQVGSDARLKNDISQLDERYLNLFDKLSPAKYTYKNNGKKSIGYIAQGVALAMDSVKITKDESGIVNYDGEYLSLNYDAIAAITAYALQDTRKRLEEAEKEIEELKRKLDQ